MLGKPTCKKCKGSGVLYRNVDTGCLFLCPCILVFPDYLSKANRIFVDAGIDRLRKNTGWQDPLQYQR